MQRERDRLLAKCAWRLIPFMAVLYLVNYLDRVNAGFAALTMNKDLGFSPSVFGLGGGIFFAGYLLFQIPGNAIVERFGARISICCIMLAWGVISAATAFVHAAPTFYMLRFVLGIAEAAFFPGAIFYLTLWFPRADRARFTAAFACAIPMSGIVGGPMSSLVLRMDGILGLHGWQWLFLIEGLPACVLAVAVLRMLPDRPAGALWLSQREKAALAARLSEEPETEDRELADAMRNPRVVGIALAGLGRGAALYGATLWLPQMVQAMGFANLLVGFIVTIPYIASVIAMIIWGYSSDRSGDRIWHVALPTLVAAAGFTGAAIFRGNLPMLASLTLCMVGLLAATSPHFVLASSFLRGKAAAASIALLNSATSVGGFIGPVLIGALKQQSGSYAPAMGVLSLGLFASALIIIAVGRAGSQSANSIPRTAGSNRVTVQIPLAGQK